MPANPETFVRAFDARWNAHDVEAVIAGFTDDAVVRFVPPPPPPQPGVFEGKEQVRRFVEELIRGFHVESRNFRGSGERVSWDSTLTGDLFRQMGAEPATGSAEAVLQGDKVREFIITLSPDTLAKMQAAGGRGS